MLSRGGNDLIKRQFEFLENDLKKANLNRDSVPWIVVNGHRSMYCSCDNDCLGDCLLYTSPSPRDKRQSRMPSSA